jgi:2,3-dihydro-2,3-dihydroxybenzoate dehydrogenase
LGLAIAQAFAADGARIAINDIDQNAAWRLAERLSSQTDALTVVGDVASRRDVQGIFESTVTQFGRLDVVINNAGVISTSPIHAYDEESWDRTIEVNLKGTFLCSQAAARHFISIGRGAIVNVGSVNGKIARLNSSAYCASKAAISQFTRVLALELAPHGVRANTLSPGSCGGVMAAAHYPKGDAERLLLRGDLESWRLGVPLGRLCTPEDVAAAAVFLASDAARHITGQEIFVDGGQTIF